MKKTPLAFILFLSFAMSLSAWEHNLGLEAGFPCISLRANDDGNKNIFEPALQARYYGVAENGFCLSAAIGAGLPISKDFTLNGESATAKGFGMNLALGAGYEFVLSQRLTLAALGSLSLDWLRFSYKKEFKAPITGGYATADWTQTDDALFAGIGAEVLARFFLTDQLSLSASCALRFIDGGTLWKNGSKIGRDYDNSQNLRGNIIFTPTLGACWTF